MSKQKVLTKYQTFYNHLILLSENKTFNLQDRIKGKLQGLAFCVDNLIHHAKQLGDNNKLIDLETCYERYLQHYLKIFV